MARTHEARTAAHREFGVLQQFGSNLRDFFALLFRPPRPNQVRPAAVGLMRALIAALASLAAIAATILLLDAPASTAVRQLPSWLILFFDIVTDFGKSGWLFFPIGLLLLLLAAITPGNFPRSSRLVVESFAIRLSFVFAAIALPGLFVTVLKRVIGRARPFVEPDGGSFVLAPFGWSADYASIPSGHGTTAFAAAIAIGAVWPRTRPFVWLYAILIAVSRVVVTAHYPSDLLASAFFGIVGALLVRHTFAVRRLGFGVDYTGAVHRLPGPSSGRLKAVARTLLAQ